jgi:L-ribulose-5-phosphate 3-epimerase
MLNFNLRNYNAHCSQRCVATFESTCMLLGYNTNGLCHHDPVDAIELLHEIGYRSVAITIDHATLNPYNMGWEQELKRVRHALKQTGMQHVLETGARFLLDKYVKHEPTLMSNSPELRQLRIDFYFRIIEMSAELGSQCVSLWSGILREPLSEADGFNRLIDGLQPILEYATKFQVPLGFEPEPGMFIDSMIKYKRLLELIDSPNFQLTLDVGHLHCLAETPVDKYIALYAEKLVNVHIEDMLVGVHEHLPLGTGEMEFPPILHALHRANYTGGVHVELSRHSHIGPELAAQSFMFLQQVLEQIKES